VHVEGHKGATGTYSRSATPALVKWLLSGLHKDAPPEKDWWESRAEKNLYEAMAVALHNFPPPSITMRFLAKTLSRGILNGNEYMIGVKQSKMLLGTPIWVAEASPYSSEENQGVSMISGSFIMVLKRTPQLYEHPCPAAWRLTKLVQHASAV